MTLRGGARRPAAEAHAGPAALPVPTTFGGNGQRSHKNSFRSRSVRFQSGTTSAHIAFSIYLCIGGAQVLSVAAPRAVRPGAGPGPGRGRAYLLRD